MNYELGTKNFCSSAFYALGSKFPQNLWSLSERGPNEVVLRSKFYALSFKEQLFVL